MGNNTNPVPRSPRTAVTAWGALHHPIFTGNAAALGLLPAQASGYKAALDAYNAAFAGQVAARSAALTATKDANTKFTALLASQGDVVRTIRAFAETQGNPSTVYNLAQVPGPSAGSPVPPPAQPTELTVTLVPDSGYLSLAWKASNPANGGGTSYIVKRRLPGEDAFSFVGVTGTKKFTDKTLIAGPDWVEYTVQGQRADSSGPVSAIFTVNFGQAGGGLTAFVASGNSGKMAA